MTDRPLDLVFLWHMHQPDYRDRGCGEFVLPWTYLHALKDYTDMAAHLERHPRIRAVVNFVPVLLDQIDDYVAQFEQGSFRDPLLRWLDTEHLDTIDPAERQQLLTTCFRCHAPTMRTPFPPYRRLHELYMSIDRAGAFASAYLSGVYLCDLLVWYHLAWTGETLRRQEPLLAELMARGEGFNRTDRKNLLALIHRTLAGLVPRYRALQDRGQIELSATPQAHPLAPLLLDFGAAKERLPDMVLPQASGYPGGRERVEAHIRAAKESHASRFGRPPVGLWPAEGAISTAFAGQMAAAGCRWAASGESVLKNSLAAGHEDGRIENPAHRPWTLADAPGLTLFFRDDRLSDLIGFEYAKWHGRDAAAHFVAQLEALAADAPAGQTPQVSVILDGENAWETYPYNAYYFFEALYGLLEAHPSIRTRTYAQILDSPPVLPPSTFSRLVAGSWVYGTLSTWIGSPAKNRAWDLLCAAKRSYDQVMRSGRLSAEDAARAEALLAVCESSDPFWWLGDAHAPAAVADFDRLFRRNLANLYRSLDLSAPAQLDVPLIDDHAHHDEGLGSGTMRRAGEYPLQPPQHR